MVSVNTTVILYSSEIVYCNRLRMLLDAETAASAVRNLNEYDIGGRQLRVDYAAMDPQVENARQQGRHHQVSLSAVHFAISDTMR